MKRRIPIIALMLALVTLFSACAMPAAVQKGKEATPANLQEGNNFNADMENENNNVSNGRVWPWEDPSITLPPFELTEEAVANGITVTEPGTIKSLKIFVIGDASARDAWYYFPQLAKEAGIQIRIVLMYSNNNKGDLVTHKNYATYTQYENTGDGWVTVSTDADMVKALKSDQWQYLIINQSIKNSGVLGSVNPASHLYLDEILRTARTEIPKGSSNTKCMWMQTWAYEINSRNNLFNGFSSYNNDQMAMYNAINAVIQAEVVSNYYIKAKPKNATKIPTNVLNDSVIPVGTAVQNMRESYWTDGITKDGEYLSTTGKALAALMLFKSITGYDINDMELSDPVFDHARPHLGVIKESVNNAYLSPYAVSPSVYDTLD